MESEHFLERCREKVIEYYEEEEYSTIKAEDIFIVWYNETLQNYELQNYECHMGITIDDKIYFKFTYDGDENQFIGMTVYSRIEKSDYSAHFDDTKAIGEQFLKECKKKVFEHYEKWMGKSYREYLNAAMDRIMIIWYSEMLQNNKCLVKPMMDDGSYFKFTYNKDKNQLHMDMYFFVHFDYEV